MRTYYTPPLEQIRTLADPNEQWLSLQRYPQSYVGFHPEVRAANLGNYIGPMLDFAADPDSSPSQLVRARAIELALDATYSRYKVQIGEDVARLRAGVENTIPEYATHGGIAAGFGWLDMAPGTYTRAYHGLFGYLARKEGVHRDLLFPDHHDYPDPLNEPDDVPVAVGMLLDKLIGEVGPNAPFISPKVLTDALDIALDFRGEAYQSALADPSNPITAFARVSRLTRAGGFEHDDPIDFLYGLPEEERSEYAKVLNRLYEAVPGLASAFPTIDQEVINKGVRGLIANSLFALESFARNDHSINATFRWPDGPPIPMQENDPVSVLNMLAQAMETLARTIHSPTTKIEHTRSTDTYSQFTFWDPDNQPVPVVAYHARATGGNTFDPTYEFAGDATSRWRVKLQPDGPICLENAKQTPDTLTFRVDLDRFGTALDVGALQRNPFMNPKDVDNDVEVRVGRLLAYGNWLRAARKGEHPTMNHVRALNAAYGDPAIFSASVLSQVALWQSIGDARDGQPLLIQSSPTRQHAA